jgi:2-polyprenyl-3-methyl-5-hydroxy-6-metoxy-1,4-benzoquinol methylase
MIDRQTATKLFYDIVEKETSKPWQYWSDLIQEISDDALMNQKMRTEWHNKSRDSHQSIRQYYIESDTWLAQSLKYRECLINIAVMDRIELDQARHIKFTSFLKPNSKILDYGGGFFNDSWQLAITGHHIELAEIDGPISRIVSSFIKETDCKHVSVLPVTTDYPLTSMYDGCICLETLEHIKNPDVLLKHMIDHLRPNSPLAMSVSFGDTSHAPYHIAELAHWGTPGVWDNKTMSYGMVLEYQDATSLRVWCKQ